MEWQLWAAWDFVHSDNNWRQVAQSVERRTLDAEVPGLKPVLGTLWWGRVPPNQPYPMGAALAATTLLAEWCPSIPRKGVNIVKKMKHVHMKNLGVFSPENSSIHMYCMTLFGVSKETTMSENQRTHCLCPLSYMKSKLCCQFTRSNTERRYQRVEDLSK